MISNYLMKEYKVKKVSYSIKNERYCDIGHIRAYLAECEDSRWLVVITDEYRDEVEVLVLNTRETAMKRIRARGFWTRMSKIYPRKHWI